MPALMMTLGASYRLEGKSGARDVAASEFYQGAYFTRSSPAEILTSVSIALPPAGHGYATKNSSARWRLRHRRPPLSCSRCPAARLPLARSSHNLAETPLLATDPQSRDRYQPRRCFAEKSRRPRRRRSCRRPRTRAARSNTAKHVGGNHGDAGAGRAPWLLG